MTTLKHTEKEMLFLREELSTMWHLVLAQLEKARLAFERNDMTVAREVLSREKRVDALELKIDRTCENYIALYSPVAIDLRLVLSTMKICRTLERIGDFAAAIALYVLEADCKDLPDSLIDELRLQRMFDVVQRMLSDSYVAFEQDNTRVSAHILAQDEEVNNIYHEAPKTIARHLQTHPADAYCAMKLMLLVRKLERIGDHCSNIVEEIVFYVDARVLKHGTDLAHEE